MTMLSSDAIREIADKILHEKLDAFGYVGVDVTEGVDQDEEEALFIVGTMRRNADVPPGKVTSEAAAILSRALLEKDELRFPYFTLTREGEDLAES